MCVQPLSGPSAPLGCVDPANGSQIRCAVAPRVVWQGPALKTRGPALQYPFWRVSLLCQTRDLGDNPSSPKSQDGLNTVEHACELRSHELFGNVGDARSTAQTPTGTQVQPPPHNHSHTSSIAPIISTWMTRIYVRIYCPRHNVTCFINNQYRFLAPCV